MNEGFGRDIPGVPSNDDVTAPEAVTEETAAPEEAPVAGEAAAPEAELTDEELEAATAPEEEVAAEDDVPEQDDAELLGSGEEGLRGDAPDEDGELRAVAPTAGDDLPGQPAVHARLAAAEAARGEYPYATPAMATMVDTSGTGKTTVKAAVISAEAAAVAAMAASAATASAAATAWRSARGIDVDDRYTRELRTTTD